MSQRKASVEKDLSHVENTMANLGLIHKLLEIIGIKSEYIESPRLRESIQDDVKESRSHVKSAQKELGHLQQKYEKQINK